MTTSLRRLACLLGGLQIGLAVAGPAAAETMQLTFVEQEAGIEPYEVRMLVNEDFLRIDDGPEAGGFLLLRRADGMVYSVVHENGSVLDIPRAPIPETPPVPVNPSEEYEADPKAPQVAGRNVLSYRQHFGGETCFSAVVAEDLLPEVRAAMRELNRTLAGQQMKTIDNFPAETISPCLLARLVYARQNFLDRGLPLLEWDEDGYRRKLVDFHPLSDVPADLFVVPVDYEHYEIGAVPGP